ncbi:COX15/CtaA family protein [Granulicella tundricola]|uniref:Cytochrome oxidase assembly n=1 Tax=Granulicella tundricola (strain ATCC BAA-1859 / DSM 23138 / MP5ACTX9) TaxID=1198114 RepID=E8WZD4_GRATM|nr:COX15/CtaA family protein [Granulicella tundricola]ADW68822.1 cytochrome oxidase assembly [Granulicella tundricola MP5ACTX9]
MATAAMVSERVGVSRRAARFAWGVVGYNVLVVLWGALVRATGSGAGCGNNWPLCNGVAIPVSPTLHTVIEFTHRQMVTGDVIAIVAMLVWTFRATLKGAAARVFAVISTVLLVNEAFLGALLVKLGYVTGNQSVGRMVLLSVHLSNTLILVAALTMTARMLGTGQGWRGLRAKGMDKVAAVVGLVATLVVGVSGSLAALGDTLFPASSLRAAVAADLDVHSPWLLRLRGLHPLSAVVAAGFVVWLVVRARREGLGRGMNLVLGLLGLQFALGVLDVLLLAPAWMQMVHLLGADLYWVALVGLAAGVVWPMESRLAPLPRQKA